jgi:hypothetical protein
MAVAGKSAIATKRNVNANSASERTRVAEANRAVAAEKVAAAKEAVVSKATEIPQHEPKHLLHNRCNCCYRDRPQAARPVLGVGVACARPKMSISGDFPSHGRMTLAVAG